MAVDGGAGGAGGSASSSLSRFQRAVLVWDYLGILKDSSGKSSTKPSPKPKRVKNTYADFEDYISVYEPLLFEEVKAQIVQGKDEEDATQWEKAAVSTCDESDGFQSVSLAVRDEFREEVSENDLLLLSEDKFKEGAAPNFYAFALVEHRGGSGALINLKTFLSGEVKGLKLSKVESSRLSRMHSHINRKDRNNFLWILNICSLSTIIREFVAMHSVASLPFKDLILSAAETGSDTKDHAWNIPPPLMEFLESSVNVSQFDAIKAGLSRRRFVLIQGPPGTGKTQTILMLLNAVLHSTPVRVQTRGGLADLVSRPTMSNHDRYLHWTKASPWLTGVNPRDLIMPEDGDDGFYPTGDELKPEVVNTNRKYKVHVLVCAPSNSALDEIVLRVLQTGLHDEDDHVYNPKIVRIGLKAHHSVRAVSLDYLVEQKLAAAYDSQKLGTRRPDRDGIRASILDEAAIVFSTLSFSGSSLFTRMNRMFDVVIIDEAAQAVEPATLIPMAHGCRQVFLVGDPVQLPATVISTIAEKSGYGTSLFKRLQGAGFPVQMLKTQYRMHPEISMFPSSEFYAGSLENGDSVANQTKRKWHTYRCFGPFCFFDIDGVESQQSGSGSWVNADEVDFIILLYHKLAEMYPDLRSSSQFAIISPYRNQVKLLRDRVRSNFGEKSDVAVDINTVDGFQGREKDVTIFSCVRANSSGGIGFVADFRRMNVGITRARASVLVVGSASTLMNDKHWSNLVTSAKDRNCYFKVPKPFASFFSDDNLAKFKVEVKRRQNLKEEPSKMEDKPEMGSEFDGNLDQGGGDDDDDDIVDYGGDD